MLLLCLKGPIYSSLVQLFLCLLHWTLNGNEVGGERSVTEMFISAPECVMSFLWHSFMKFSLNFVKELNLSTSSLGQVDLWVGKCMVLDVCTVASFTDLKSCLVLTFVWTYCSLIWFHLALSIGLVIHISARLFPVQIFATTDYLGVDSVLLVQCGDGINCSPVKPL